MMRRAYVVGSVPVILVVALAIAVGTSAAGPAAGAGPGRRIATPVASATVADAAEVARGGKLYEANCAVCHKASGAGGVKLGRATSADLRAPDLEKTYRTEALLRRAILDGKDEKGKRLDPVMPRWRGALSATDVNAIIGFLKTLHD